MKVFKFLYVKPVLLILVLSFSTSCSTDNTDEKTAETPAVANEETEMTNDLANGDTSEETQVTNGEVANEIVSTVPTLTAGPANGWLDSEGEVEVNNDNSSESSTWSDLPYGVRTYVREQTCSGGEVISSDLVVDFKDVELAPNVAISNAYSLPYIYCNDENTYCSSFKIEDGARLVNNERTHSNTLGWEVPVLFFDDLRNSDYNVTLIPKFKRRDPLDGNKVKEILFVEGNITVNFPNTKTCGDNVGDVRCEIENECINAPESHICIFDYSKCSSGSSTYLHTISCNKGYVETTDDTVGVFFGTETKSPRLAKRCVKESTQH